MLPKLWYLQTKLWFATILKLQHTSFHVQFYYNNSFEFKNIDLTDYITIAFQTQMLFRFDLLIDINYLKLLCKPVNQLFIMKSFHYKLLNVLFCTLIWPSFPAMSWFLPYCKYLYIPSSQVFCKSVCFDIRWNNRQ